MVYSYNRLQPQVGSYLSTLGNGKQYGEDINSKIWERVICNKIEELVVVPKKLTLEWECTVNGFTHSGQVTDNLDPVVRQGLTVDLAKLSGTGFTARNANGTALANGIQVKPALYLHHNTTRFDRVVDNVIDLENTVAGGANADTKVAVHNNTNGFITPSKFIITLDPDDPSGKWNNSSSTSTRLNEEHASRVSDRDYFKKLIQDYASLCLAQTFYSDWDPTQKDHYLYRLDDIENHYDKIDKKEQDKVLWEKQQDKLSSEIKTIVKQLRGNLKFPPNATAPAGHQAFMASHDIDRLIEALDRNADKLSNMRGPSRPLVRSSAPKAAADGAFNYI